MTPQPDPRPSAPGLREIIEDWEYPVSPGMLAAIEEWGRAERRAEREYIADALQPYLESLRASGQEYASISLAEGIRRIRALPDADEAAP